MALHLDSFISGRSPNAEVDARHYHLKSAAWLMHYTISDMMTIKPLALTDLTKQQTMLAELTTEAMLDKVGN